MTRPAAPGDGAAGPAPVVAVVGAGAAGTLVAARLAREAVRRDRPLDLLLVDPSPRTGRGAAYGTDHPAHRLNVPAGRISALPELPDDFLRWLRESDPRAHPYDFAARRDYGRYLEQVLAGALVAARGRVRLERRHATATAVTPDGGRLRLTAGGDRVVDAVVLATGDGPPSTAWAPDALVRSERLVADPWAPGALAAVPDGVPVLLVGTGLTMLDVALALDRPGRRLSAVSRTGLLPRAHRRRPPASAAPAPHVPDGPLTADALAEVVRRHVLTTARRHGDWRPAVDSLRPVTQELWRRLPEAERARLRSRHQRGWDVLRHRAAPSSGAALQRLRAAGRLELAPGRVVGARATPDGVEVALEQPDGGRRTLHVGAVVACTGPDGDVRTRADPLLAALLADGTAAPGPLGLGLATDARGRVRGADGRPRTWLWTLGALRRGELFESVAVPEIRGQAREVAEGVWDALASVSPSAPPASRAYPPVPS